MKSRIPRFVFGCIALALFSAHAAARAEPAKTYSDADALDIYAAILPSGWPARVANAKRLIIRSETGTYEMCLKPEAGSDKRLLEAIDNYLELNKKTWLLDEKLKIDRPYKFVFAAELANIFSQGAGRWSTFYERYPDSGGWMELSAVGFSADKSVAVAYIGHHCGDLCGGGHFDVLEKVTERWQPLNWKGTKCAWVS